MKVNKKIFLGAGLISSLLFFSGVLAATTSIRVPVSDGTYKQWTTSTGTSHYKLVDETPCNATDYNYTTTVSHRDSYVISLSGIGNGSDITDIAIVPCASRHLSGGGSSAMNVFYRFEGVNSADAGSYALTGTSPVPLATTTFSGLSLVRKLTSQLQVGAVYVSGDKGARLSRIAAQITYIPLTAPSGLSATNVSGTQNDITWTDNSSIEDWFDVERSLGSRTGPWTGIGSTTPNVVIYNDTTVASDQTYYYRVRANNGGAGSAYSNIDYAITATVVPNAPSNFSVTGSSTAANLSWTDNSSNEEGFKIERSANGLDFSEIHVTGLNIVSYYDTGLAAGTYYYRVRAYNAIGDSLYSNTVSVTLP